MTDTALPPLDVSIVTFNSARWIEGFLASLAGQGYPADRLRLWVRDNGSTPEQFEACRRAIELHAPRFGGVHVDRGENRGFGYGHNRNVERGRAALVLVSNVDLEFAPGALVTAVAALLADGDAVACREFRQQPYEHPKHYHPATLETAWCSSACVLFRRAAFTAVGGYEERIFLYGEDVELSYRLRDRGYALKYCPAAVCVHHSYAHAGEVKPEQFFGSAAANLRLRLRYGTAFEIAVGLLLQLGLWLRPRPLPRYYRRLAVEAWRLLRDAPHFLATRRRSAAPFPFRGWGYGPRREGAFHRVPESGAAAARVSIVVRTHAGRLGWLREAVASVANQTWPLVELVLVEDGTALAREVADDARAGGRFTGVTYLPLPKGGRSRAGNAGLEAACGDLIGFLDDDDLLYADHVETLARELAAHPEAGAAYGLAFEVPTAVVSTEPFRYRERAPALVHDSPFSREALARRNFLPIQTVLFRRALYERHGGFDVDLEVHEDWNLWTRYSREATFVRVRKTTSLYRIPADADELLRRNCALEDGHARARAKLPAPAVTSSAGWRTLSAHGVRRLLAVLPFLRPLYLPAHRCAAWLRRRRAASGIMPPRRDARTGAAS